MKTRAQRNSTILSVLFMLVFSTTFAADTWRTELLRQRADKDREFRASPTSPMAGIARLSVPAPGHKMIIATPHGVTIEESGTGVGTNLSDWCTVLVSADKWRWRNNKLDAEITAGATIRLGRFTLLGYPATEALTLLVFDPQRPILLHFKGLRYFPPQAAWAIPARLERLPDPRLVRMLTSRNLKKEFYRYALIHFRAGDRELTLTAFKSTLQGEEATTLFVPFKDDSNGDSSYEAGRFLDIPEPAGNEFILDFNNAYNPLCNYSPAYNCPMPPRENFLNIAVPAGEKVYPHQQE